MGWACAHVAMASLVVVVVVVVVVFACTDSVQEVFRRTAPETRALSAVVRIKIDARILTICAGCKNKRLFWGGSVIAIGDTRYRI